MAQLHAKHTNTYWLLPPLDTKHRPATTSRKLPNPNPLGDQCMMHP